MFSSTPSMSSSAGGAFGSPFLFGPPTGFPSPFSTPATSSSPFSFRGFTPFSKGSRVTSYTKTTEFDRGERKMLVSISAMPAYSDKSHEELRWEDHHQFDTAGGGVVPAFARNCSTGLSPIFPSVRSNPFATTVTTPSIGQSPFLNPIPLSDPTVYRGPLPPSVPSNPFPTTVTPPTIGQSPFLNHVKPNLESVLDKMEEWEKSTQLICKDVKCVQEDMKSWIERDRSVELEKIEATQTINQLREELAHVTRSKEAIIAEYLASPAFTKRLDEEHEKRLSKILHPCYVKALGEVQTKFPEIKPFTSQRPATASVSSYTSAFGSRVGFGQSINSNVSSTASSGSQYTFGQASNLFGSAPNSGGTSMGLFGGSSFGQSSNLFGSAPNYGGKSMGVFGGSSFGQSNLFGSAPNNDGTSTGVFGKSSFGQNNNLFGSSPNNSGTSTGVFGGSPFGQSSSIFGSVPNNGGTSTGVFGQKPSSIPFGQSSNYGGKSTGIFGQTASSNSFGQNNNIFGSVPGNGGTSAGVYGQTASSSSFGQRSNIFGSVPNNGGTSMGLFGTTVSSNPFGFQVGSIPTSGGTSMGVSGATSSSPILWSSSTASTTFSQVPASIASSSSGFGSGCMTSSGQATVPWDKSSSSGANTFSFGTQSFGGKRGSRVTSYTKTTELDEKGQLVSISAMPAYKDKSHEELRWEDHHQFNAGGGGVVPSSAQSNDFKNPFARTESTFPNPFTPSVSSNLFPVTVTPPSVGQHSFPNPAPPVPSNPFATAVTPPSIGQHSSLNFVPPSAPSNLFSTTVMTPSLDATQSVTSPFSPLKPNPLLNNSCSAPATSVTQPVSIFEPNKSLFNLTTPTAPHYPSINSSSTGAASIVGPNYTNSFASSSYMCTTVAPPITVSVPCTDSLQTASLPAPSWPSQTNQTGGLSIGGFDGFKGVAGQSTLVQQLSSQNTEVKQSPIPSPFETPSAVSQVLTAPPVRYGISSIPVCDKQPPPARSPSLLNIRHLSSHRQRWLPIPKYNPKIDGRKVAFFDDDQKTPTTARKEAPLLPRSNPRAYISGLYEELNPRVNSNNTSFEKNSSTDTYKNGEVELLSAPDQEGSLNQDKYGISSETDAAEHNHNTDSAHGDQPIKKEIYLNVYELMPKLKHSDYFFEPQMDELAIKESSEPGFCSHVKDFVVGRRGYGNIKFLGETDVRELDLHSYIEFRNREVIVYMDESKKPPIGQGLNKAAEITLCNIKVVDKKTGNQYVNGPNVDKFKEKLMKKTAEQGAEFVSYNPVQGEWKFRVKHF